MKVKRVSNFNLFDICHVDACVIKEERNACYYSHPLFEKSENIKENMKSKNIIFLRLALSV